MRSIGFSTGTLARSDWREAIKMLAGSHASAIELSALREPEFEPLIKFIKECNLPEFEYVSFHIPSKLSILTERELVLSLEPVVGRNWPIVVHPNIIRDFTLWTHFGNLLCIENMDGRKDIGRNVNEFLSLFDKLTDASFCLDLGHTRHVDRTMSQAETLLRKLSDRLRMIHLSEVNSNGCHVPLSLMSLLSFSRLIKIIPSDCPIILESPLETLGIDDEIARVNYFMSKDHDPHPRMQLAG